MDWMIEGLEFRCAHDGCGRTEQSHVGEIPPGWYCEQLQGSPQFRALCWEHAAPTMTQLLVGTPDNIEAQQAAQAA